MAKVNAERHTLIIKDRLIKRFNYWKSENADMLDELKSKDTKSMELKHRQDHAATLIILESSIATIERAVEEIKHIAI